MFSKVTDLRSKLVHSKNGQPNHLIFLLLISLFALLCSACSAASAEETNSSAEASEPTAAESGPQILFSSHRDGNSEIFVMNADGSDQRQLTDGNSIDFEGDEDDPEWRTSFVQARNPAWSPDNQQIAFGFVGEIFIMNADGSDARQLTEGNGVTIDPIWSPDGRRIAFISNEDGDRDIWIINEDGTGLQNLTDNREQVASPSWSPDGQTIAYNSGFPIAISLMSVDSKETHLLLEGKEGYGWEAAWSPDGKQIAFVSLRDGDDEIFVVNVDGSDLRQITDNDDKDGSPAWSPDGQQLAFTSDRDGDWEIYAIKVDGSDVRQLTDNDTIDESPMWSSAP